MSINLPIYLDNAATTRVDPRVRDKMIPYLSDIYGNAASSSHIFGWQAEKAIKKAREQIASLINADIKEIIFTSGATESDNLAIKGTAQFYSNKGKHLITAKTEHKAVLDTMGELERQGYEVSYLDVEENGLISLDALEKAIRQDTILVSIMWVNNEIGVIQPIQKIGELCREHQLVFHVDATQACGKIPIDMQQHNIHLMSMNAHKIYGPKGIGALYVRRKPRARIAAQIQGGGHERGMRSGTLATHQIVGMGEAYAIAQKEMQADNAKALHLREIFLAELKDLPEVYINGDLEQRIAQNINISFNFVEGESLMMAVKELAISSGSACTSATLEPSYVLRALGRNDELAHSSLRISTGRFNSEEEIIYAAHLLKEKVIKLRELSPLWEMYEEGIDLKNYTWADLQ